MTDIILKNRVNITYQFQAINYLQISVTKVSKSSNFIFNIETFLNLKLHGKLQEKKKKTSLHIKKNLKLLSLIMNTLFTNYRQKDDKLVY